MCLHKLYIFSKNRDAVAALKGYSFQQLKTLEDWLEARIAGRDTEIYCEYEDDILIRNIGLQKTVFKQIKLYSTDFSFTSESITKAISHFFSLYVKIEYSFDQVEFHFETNVSIVGKDIKDNDAILLSEWNTDQEQISPELLSRLRSRVKKILDDYISNRVTELSKNIELKSEVQKAKNVYDNLSDSDFDSFIKCIKWDFSKEESSAAVESILLRIKGLISRLPLPLESAKIEIYSSLLVNEVFQRSIQDDPEQRRLTNQLLDKILLDAGDLEDQWYSETYSQFKNSKVSQFFHGEFQSVIAASRYCRWKNLDDTHKLFWLEILTQYIGFGDSPILKKRRAIYEYIFLKIGHDPEKRDSKYSLNTDNDLIRYYIEQWSDDVYLSDIETDIVFLQLIKTQIKNSDLEFPVEEINKWEEKIKNYLESEVQKTSHADRLCELYELQGHLAQTDTLNQVSSYKEGLEYYRKIIPLIKDTKFYSLASLYDQMTEITKAIAKYDLDDSYLDLTDEFMEEIKPYADKTGLREKSAFDLIERAIYHSKRNNSSNNLKALQLLHRAKDELRIDYTRKAYTFSLLEISKIYMRLGMVYASKYYALISYWSIWQSTDHNLKQYLPDSFFQIMHTDYESGAWIRALLDFEVYLFSKKEFDQRGFQIESDQRFQFALSETAMIIYSSPIIYPIISSYIEKIKQDYGFIWTDYLEPTISEIQKQLPDKESVYEVLRKNIIDQPLNDLGATRSIHFKALSIDWFFEFENILVMTGIAEEFISTLQITLCEIARIKPEIISKNKVIKIKIQEGLYQKNLTGENEWMIKIPQFDSNESQLVNKHYMYLGMLTQYILQPVCNMNQKEFKKFFLQLLSEYNLGSKVIEAAAYQRVFNKTVIHDDQVSIIMSASTPPFVDESLSLTYQNWLRT